LYKGGIKVKPVEYINEEELLDKAIRLLTDKLGPLETSRFLSIVNQKKRIESARLQLKNGQTISHEDLQKEIDQWLSSK